MSLPAERQGTSHPFHIYPRISDLATLADAETIIWASIHHLCSSAVVEHVAAAFHNISRRADRRSVATNLKLYVRQAAEFYDVARTAKPNTAPLMYYYSFLNLAKALCELKKPRLHERTECYSHGLHWRPNPRKVVNLPFEKVTISNRRGMWQTLWEALVSSRYTSASQVNLPIKVLFSYCPEVSAEYLHAFGMPLGFIDLENPAVKWDPKKREVWLRFSIARWHFESRGVFAPGVLAQMASTRSGYSEVGPKNPEFRHFESTTPLVMTPSQYPGSAIADDIAAMNPAAMLDRGRKLSYYILLRRPLQRYFSLPLPQALVIYTILFWLGSLVRYDPHSVQWLMDSQYWELIDGFMSQSRLWLLELFQWEFYKTETTLYSAR